MPVAATLASLLLLVEAVTKLPAYVPFCGLALIETLSGERTEVEDPFLGLIKAQQPNERFDAFQKQLLDEMAQSYGL